MIQKLNDKVNQIYENIENQTQINKEKMSLLEDKQSSNFKSMSELIDNLMREVQSSQQYIQIQKEQSILDTSKAGLIDQ